MTSSGISEVDKRVTYLARGIRAYHARAGCQCWWSDLRRGRSGVEEAAEEEEAAAAGSKTATCYQAHS